MPVAFAVVLAGGEGRRLMPLTRDRAKPAVPFGGSYRIIDFVLSNLANSGHRRIVVLTQYKSHSLDRHISQAWHLSPLLGNYVAPVPAQMRRGPRWYAGSADAIYQNLNLIYDENPEHTLVFGADHIYRMDAAQMVADHIASDADVTVACIALPRDQARDFGVFEVDSYGNVIGFFEKPADPPPIPWASHLSLVSMGNYVFRTKALIEALTIDARNESSRHDMGGDIVPMMVAKGQARVYDFTKNEVPGAQDRDRSYWRDVGTLDSFFEANMDLVAVHPVFNLYNQDWPIYTWHEPLPPAKLVFDEEGRRGQAIDSLLSLGVIVAGGTVRRSVLSPGVFVDAGALVEESVLFNRVRVGEGAVVRRAILDKEVVVPPGARIGVDPDQDRLHYTVSERGIVVLGKRERVWMPTAASSRPPQ
jgi:glucose-1-phosphate adenylyltransferase